MGLQLVKPQISNGCRARIRMGSVFQTVTNLIGTSQPGRTPAVGQGAFCPVNRML